jgi:hypothetical protein
MADGDDLARPGHHGVGIEAVLQGAVEAFPFEAPACSLVEIEDCAAVVVVLTAAVGKQRLDGRWLAGACGLGRGRSGAVRTFLASYHGGSPLLA